MNAKLPRDRPPYKTPQQRWGFFFNKRLTVFFIYSLFISYYSFTMSVDRLTQRNLPSISQGYWQVCNDSFDRNIYTSADMQRQQRGNCFTLSEFLCDTLIANVAVAATGICIEVLPSRRNYHASTWAVLERSRQIVRLDLLDESPVPQPQLAGVASALVSLANSAAEALYISTDLGTDSVESVVARIPISEAYEWPETPGRHEAVFLNAPLGIQTLHTLAHLGGIRHLLNKSEQVIAAQLPALPR
jgi:hypothetical protein